MRMSYTTPIKFAYSEESNERDGLSRTIIEVTSQFGENEINVFWCEWRGEHGTQVYMSQSASVNDTATVRMPFNPSIYKALKEKTVYIGKNAVPIDISEDGLPDEENPNIYILWGGVDNVLENNQILEFKVRRYGRK